jgi:hypothetical protein
MHDARNVYFPSGFKICLISLIVFTNDLIEIEISIRLHEGSDVAMYCNVLHEGSDVAMY